MVRLDQRAGQGVASYTCEYSPPEGVKKPSIIIT